MKKHFLFIYIILITGLGYGVDFDYGASIDSYIGKSIEEESSIFGFEKVSLYSSIEVSDSLSFAIDGFYKYTYNTASEVSEPHTFDFTTLIATLPLGHSSLIIGRNNFSDYSSNIVSHTLDGISASIPLGFGTILANIGYSGLVNQNEVTLFTTGEDGDLINRIIEGVDLVREMESLAMWASIYSQQDMNDLENNLSIYGGGGVSGAIGSEFYYTVSANYQTGVFPYLNSSEESVSTNISAGMGVVTLNWYIDSDNKLIQNLSPYLTLDLGVSSGDSDLTNTSLGVAQDNDISNGVSLFSPMVSGGPGAVYSINNQNLSYLKLQASASPLNNLQTQLGTVVFFRTVEGPISDTDSNTDESGNYLGTEVSLTTNFRPFSDLGVSVSGGVFFPDGTILEQDPTGLITAFISLSL